jgi:hypothetical protein
MYIYRTTVPSLFGSRLISSACSKRLDAPISVCPIIIPSHGPMRINYPKTASQVYKNPGESRSVKVAHSSDAWLCGFISLMLGTHCGGLNGGLSVARWDS